MLDWEWWSKGEHTLEGVHGITEVYVEVTNMEF
jgi:hypothetical protein